MRTHTLLVVVVIAGSATTAAAGPDGLVAAPTVIGVPTAWIQPPGAAHVSGDADHHLGSGVRITKSLGRLAEVDVASDDLLVSWWSRRRDPSWRPQRRPWASTTCGPSTPAWIR